jgi:hypothetical protein
MPGTPFAAVILSVKNTVVILSDPDPELVEGEGGSKDLHFDLVSGHDFSRAANATK